MQEHEAPEPIAPLPPARTLQVEIEGDNWRGIRKPKLRIMGYWFERAGFKPGTRVQVTCLAPGVMELRSPDALTGNPVDQASSEPLRVSP